MEQSAASPRVSSPSLFLAWLASARANKEEEANLTMSLSHTVPPEYDPNLFVDREVDLRRVVALARSLAVGESIPRRTVIFRGERGCGKTWLLRHLAEDAHTPAVGARCVTGQHLRHPGVKSWYMSLATFSGGQQEENVKTIIKALRGQIGMWQGTVPPFSDAGNLSLHELSNLVVQDVQSLLQRHVLVLVLDHVYESPSELLRILEDRLLASLIRQTKLLVVMAGRGLGYVWTTPELRLGVDEYWMQGLGMAATLQPVGPLSMQQANADREQIEATEEQLRRWSPGNPPKDASQIEEILAVTHGHPLSNLLHIDGKSAGDVVAGLLEGAFPQGMQRQGRQLLELVCVLRFFDEPQIDGLLSVCRNDQEFTDIASMQPREIVRGLLKTNLVRYDPKLAAYVMDEVIRWPLEGDLKERRQNLWRQQHEAAWDMYCRWMKAYPHAEERLKQEAEYHATRLGKLDRTTCASPERQAHEES